MRRINCYIYDCDLPMKCCMKIFAFRVIDLLYRYYASLKGPSFIVKPV